MHGVRRGSAEAARVDETGDRIRQLALSARQALELARQRDFSPEAQKAISLALEVNPDEYSLWNYRKLALKQASDSAAWQADRKLAERALLVHHKAYHAWQHRLWLLREIGHVDAALQQAWLEEESLLCEMLLRKDERNFHAWAHRANVQNLQGTSLDAEKELQFSQKCILTNFANYSAWHRRSLVLESMVSGTHGSEKVIRRELDWIREAYYTDPGVESTWVYHKWLLEGSLIQCLGPEKRKELVEEELAALNELLSIESDAQWALLAKVRVLQSLDIPDGVNEILERLEQLDPARIGFYKDLRTAK